MHLMDTLVAAFAANLASIPSTDRAPKLCSDGGSFANNATSTSPLVADCLQLISHFEPGSPISTPFTYNITKNVRHTNMFWYKSCMTGARSTVGNAEFNTEDQLALVLAATKGLKDTDRIAGTSKVNCDGTEVEWSIYSPRDSEFLTPGDRPPPTPTPIPRPPKLCKAPGPFANNATASSPLVSDCLRFTRNHDSATPWTHNITRDVRYTNLFMFESCMFGARSTVGNAQLNQEDQFALVLAATKDLDNDSRVEGTAKVDCGGTEVEWSIYSPRNSEWL